MRSSCFVCTIAPSRSCRHSTFILHQRSRLFFFGEEGAGQPGNVGCDAHASALVTLLVSAAMASAASSSLSTKCVRIIPLPLTALFPRSVIRNNPDRFRISAASAATWRRPGSLRVSILAAVLTISPNSRYRGCLIPMTPPTTEPDCSPILIRTLGSCGRLFRASSNLSLRESASSASVLQWSGLGSGTPALTTYTAPTVSTLYT
mmetsp:Transcript_13797/g.22569  ORF Transcript_13797/g.22569 Transcript_13797/m.22569 type:complete len:205 (-) Transcript_13797:737-1351(-)